MIAATCRQVWWPSTAVVRYEGDELPDWHAASGNYVGPATCEVLPTWDQALDGIGPADEPLHVARFGPKFDEPGAALDLLLSIQMVSLVPGSHTVAGIMPGRCRCPRY